MDGTENTNLTQELKCIVIALILYFLSPFSTQIIELTVVAEHFDAVIFITLARL